MRSLLAARGITKRYGHIEALRGADFDIGAGEIVALVGDNGAGKSTLVRILSGAVQPDSGTLTVDGEPTRFASPADARARGIETVYQDLALAPDLDVIANLYLGREVLRRNLLGRLGALDKRAMQALAAEHLRGLNVTIPDYSATVASLSGGQRQGVAVARAAIWAKKVIFLDEPTAALGVQQTEQVEALVKRVRDDGIAVVLVSHNMQQVMALADRIHVLRLGERVATFRTDETDSATLVAAITGLYRQETNNASAEAMRGE